MVATLFAAHRMPMLISIFWFPLSYSVCHSDFPRDEIFSPRVDNSDRDELCAFHHSFIITKFVSFYPTLWPTGVMYTNCSVLLHARMGHVLQLLFFAQAQICQGCRSGVPNGPHHLVVTLRGVACGISDIGWGGLSTSNTNVGPNNSMVKARHISRYLWCCFMSHMAM